MSGHTYRIKSSSYIGVRDEFLRCLLDWSDALEEDHGRVDEICEMLDRFYPQFDILRLFSLDSRASFCFKHRCQVIKFAVQDVGLFLAAKTHSVPELAEVLGMIGIQVGRLVLTPQDQEDRTVEASEEMASALVERMSSTIATTAGTFSPFVREMWKQIHFSIGGCLCWQCEHLRRSPMI